MCDFFTIAWPKGFLHNFATIRRQSKLAIAATSSAKNDGPFSGKEDRMADDRTITGHSDRLRINMDEDYEVRYWTQKWNVSREALAAAVSAAGVMAKGVAQQLGKDT